MCWFCSGGGPNCLLLEELCIVERVPKDHLKTWKGQLCSAKCLVMRCVACSCLLPSHRSTGDLAASGASSGISRQQRGMLPAPVVPRVLVSSICSSSNEGRCWEGYVCTLGTKPLLLPELSVWSLLYRWIQVFLWLFFLHTRAAYIILHAALILLGLCLTGARICY